MKKVLSRSIGFDELGIPSFSSFEDAIIGALEDKFGLEPVIEIDAHQESKLVYIDRQEISLKASESVEFDIPKDISGDKWADINFTIVLHSAPLNLCNTFVFENEPRVVPGVLSETTLNLLEQEIELGVWNELFRG